MRKIMSSFDQSGNLIHYIPARLTEGKDWYVSFYAVDPLTGKMKRKRIKLNRIKNINERRKYARELVERINTKLRSGWNPWIEKAAPKGNERLIRAIELFLQRKRAELRPDSMRSYESQCDRLMTWLQNRGKANVVAAAFTPYMCREYLEYCLDQGVSARTYNNYITFGRLLFNWLKERHYVKDNPFDGIKKMREQAKVRQLIPELWLIRIREYLEVHNPDFLRACMLQFYAELRPKEQVRLRMRDIDITNRVITVPADAAKNRQARYPTIPDELLPYLLSLPWDRLPLSAPVVGRKFKPGGEKVGRTDMFTQEWARMRTKLGMPKEYQFYSLRDSGIVHMIRNDVPLDIVMKQAGHADLTTTTKYVKFAKAEPVREIKRLRRGL